MWGIGRGWRKFRIIDEIIFWRFDKVRLRNLGFILWVKGNYWKVFGLVGDKFILVF